ncbi:cobalt-precorrin-6A reductase [Kutzneria sp. 744]|uniref:cobalt-precorrin-6A reductase n=1 Tax=Kutzneria sp. (strain 744) TaxID=345341 RepID=UPI0003EED91C|nr:cobalt-precorrin-6A reductase [Kutzneria sp. 744]EWM11338.1 precorrin-6X reductase [Kutzneria sp. 744]
MVRTVLVLGGTAEARRLAEALAEAGDRLRVVTSLAGRVSRPHLPPGEVRIGGFDGVEGLTAWLREERVDAVVDATHPFAARVTASAAAATSALGLPFLVLRRPGWRQAEEDDWRWVGSVAEAAELLPTVGTRALLTVGRQELEPFTRLSDVWLLARSIEQPNVPIEAVLGRGPFAVESELELLDDHDIDVLVTKDSGGDDAKLVAARRRNIPVVIVRRPPSPAVMIVSTVDQAAIWVIYGHATVS